jgi:hypothetical protein
MKPNDLELAEARAAFSKLSAAIDGLMPIAKRIESGEVSGELAEVITAQITALAAYLMHANKLSDVLGRIHLMATAIDGHVFWMKATKNLEGHQT